jgi:hypothetical protein
MKRIFVVIATFALLAGCAATSSSSSTPAATAPDAQSTASLGEVDGIPIPGPTTSAAVPVILAPTSCPTALPAIVAQADKSGTTTATSRRSAHLLICTYQDAHPAAAVCAKIEVEINTDPQAFTAFQRWTVETGQNSMWGHNPALNPRPVGHIGVEAEWVPATQTFETATMNTWVAVFLSCPLRTPQDKSLGAALGKAGLASTA